jgi:hypothetical protein
MFLKRLSSVFTKSDFSKTLHYLVSTGMFGVTECYIFFINDKQMFCIKITFCRSPKNLKFI